MKTVVVINVVDGNTLSVWPAVRVNGRSSSFIRIQGLDSNNDCERDGQSLMYRLKDRLPGSCVHVTRVHGYVDGAVLCDVNYSGRSILEHFPEYA